MTDFSCTLALLLSHQDLLDLKAMLYLDLPVALSRIMAFASNWHEIWLDLSIAFHEPFIGEFGPYVEIHCGLWRSLCHSWMTSSRKPYCYRDICLQCSPLMQSQVQNLWMYLNPNLRSPIVLLYTYKLVAFAQCHLHCISSHWIRQISQIEVYRRRPVKLLVCLAVTVWANDSDQESVHLNVMSSLTVDWCHTAVGIGPKCAYGRQVDLVWCIVFVHRRRGSSNVMNIFQANAFKAGERNGRHVIQ